MEHSRDNQTVDLEELRRLEEGGASEDAPQDETTSEPQNQQEGAESEPEGTPEETKPAETSKATEPDWGKLLEGMPYKTLDEFKKGYKELQGEYTKVREATKPIEPIIARAQRDRQFRQLLEQTAQMYEDPTLAQPFLNPQAETPPDPAQFDLYTPEGKVKYDKALSDYMSRTIGKHVDSRLARLEQQQMREQLKFQFRQKYPDANVDEVETYMSNEGMNLNPFEIAYKTASFDKIREQEYARARKELTAQLEEASKTKTPAGTAKTTVQSSPKEILEYFSKYNLDATIKKFGKQAVDKAFESIS